MLNDESWSCLELELTGVISYRQPCHFLFVLSGLRLSCLFSLPGDIQQNFFVAESVQQFYEVIYVNDRLPRLLLTGVQNTCTTLVLLLVFDHVIITTEAKHFPKELPIFGILSECHPSKMPHYQSS